MSEPGHAHFDNRVNGKKTSSSDVRPYSPTVRFRKDERVAVPAEYREIDGKRVLVRLL